MPRPDRRTALLLLAAALLVVAGGVALRGGGGERPTAAAVSAPPEPPLVVHVAGAVRAPGLYRLPRAARVADAIEAAGGPRRRALVDAINLAAPLADGQRVEVPFAASPPAPGTATSTASTSDGPLSLSRADAEALDALPGVGPATAAEIIRWRDANGGFASVDDLERVPGIGPAKLEALRPLVVP
jgi:competence protein ComEA